MDWIPEGSLSGQSNLLSGEGFFPLSSLDAVGADAPTDGVIIWRFDLIVTVEALDPDIVWNAKTAFSDQFRAGRFILRGSSGFGEEVFLNRTQQRVRDCWFYDADFGESPSGEIGSGACMIRVSNFVTGAKYVKEVYYGFEPSCAGRVRVDGEYMFLENPGNQYTYDLEPQ